MRIKDYPGTLTRQIELIAERCELTIPAPEREYQFAQHLGRKLRAELEQERKADFEVQKIIRRLELENAALKAERSLPEEVK